MAEAAVKADLGERSVTCLSGIGPKVAQKLGRLGIQTVEDLLFHLPFRYEDRSRVVAIGGLRAGQSSLIEGQVELSETVFRRRRALLVKLYDGTGFITLRFFYFSAAQHNGLARGQWLRCFGEARRGPGGLEMIHPEYERISEDQRGQVATGLTPVYPVTEGVQQASLRKWVSAALLQLEQAQPLREWLPETLLHEQVWPNLNEAVQLLHQPQQVIDFQRPLAEMPAAYVRLVFEELLAHWLSRAQLKARQRQFPAPKLLADPPVLDQFLAQLPFQLTSAQQRVLQEIQNDVARPVPMQRLLQGDVGSGKTVVSACAALMASGAGYQTALMAPTELLAEQHRANLQTWLQALGIQVVFLTGKHKGAARRELLQAIQSGQAQVVIGTHALFQEDVEFARLGLVVIDEQHRFGVHQRMALRSKGQSADLLPHQLVMTATPIPRTLAMLGYADLDLSIIDELPPGRTPVTTALVSTARRDEVIERIREGVEAKRQVYWVCTLIEESEALQCQAAEDAAALLTEHLPEGRVGLIHGRLKADEKARIMQAFQSHQLDVLVATTVIEVGVDVSNASLMVIENAERLGLAQLHQLRGRVGRGHQQSHCVLLYQAPLSNTAKQRLDTLRQTGDGFKIAEKDLSMRGPGELLGTRQAGEMRFRVANLERDSVLLERVADEGTRLLETFPERAAALIRRWLRDSVQYGDV